MNALFRKIAAVKNAPSSELLPVFEQAAKLRGAQRFGEALELLNTALESATSAADKARVYVNLALVYLDLRMQRKAYEMFARAVQANPSDIDAAQRLARHIIKKSKTPIRDSIGEIMLLVKRLGLVPGTIIDVGVNTGTPGLFDFFPDATLLMIDPIAESEPFMKHIAGLYKNAHYDLCAATSKDGEVTMSVFPSFGGSAVVEVVGRQAESVDRVVPARRIDALVAGYNAPGPYVIKADTEGGELDVLEGATGILPQTELLILETRVRPYQNAPDLTAVMERLRGWGFLPYDFIDRNYKDTDGTLKQFDLVAVRQNGFFRTEKAYKKFVAAGAEQFQHIVQSKLKNREQQLKNLQSVEP